MSHNPTEDSPRTVEDEAEFVAIIIKERMNVMEETIIDLIDSMLR